jgi:protein gp37
MTRSSIEWTDRVWNPVRGCSRASEGCRNCYAERVAVRFSGPGGPYEGFADVRSRHPQTGNATCGVRGRWTGRVELIPSKLDEPLRWKKPARVFVNSMSDLFHEELPDEAIYEVFSVMALAREHTFQVLTKRPRGMLGWAQSEPCAFLPKPWGMKGDTVASQPFRLPLPNVWLGVSVEDQATADERIPLLLQTPAAKRFVSYEPALGPVDFTDGPLDPDSTMGRWSMLDQLDWVIVGGESGPGARPFDLAWARSVVAQCREAGVACFVKQLGARPVEGDAGLNLKTCWSGAEGPNGEHRERITHPKGGDPAEWPEDLRVREFPA